MVQCELCNAVANAIERAVEDHEEFVWEYDEVKQNHECATCRRIVRLFRREYPKFAFHDQLGYVTAFYDRSWILILRDRNNGRDFRKPFIGIEMIINSGTPNEFGFSLLRHRINIAGIKRWIDQCDQSHSGTCHTITDSICKLPEANGLIFIDVEKFCLIQQPKDGRECRYAALSYVWGRAVDPFQTLMANFDSLSKPNAFKLPENIWRLPNTIKDSILLTRSLGIQYLWVDRFCIIQDDEITKPRQLASMASIYSNSYFTIAATEGADSSSGICGIGKRRPRTLPFVFFEFSPSCLMFASKPLRTNARPVYHTRGWTFQEWTFSRRMIVFHDQTATWICQRGSQQENGQRSLRISLRTSLSSLAGRPNPVAYCDSVDKYSMRNLSDPCDVLTAFDVFITMQSRAMKSGSFHGLPELFFNNMLCWHHDLSSLQQRRTDSEGNLLKQFPSWSWVGWLGATDMLLAEQASRIRMVASSNRLTYPCIIDFYKLPIDLRSEKREIIKDLHYYEARGMKPLVRDKNADPEDEDCECMQVAIGDEDVLPSSFNQLYSTVIEFRTHRMTADLAKHDCNGFSNDMALILGSKGQMIGALDLGLSFDSLNLPKHDVQLISISVSGHVCTKHARIRSPCNQYIHCDECAMECQGDRFGVYEPASDWLWSCYDVLWIEWEGDIAYRRAIGQVWKEDWDAADTEEVDIRLG